MSKLTLNALWIYRTYLLRPFPKPYCKIPYLVHRMPHLFDEKYACDCKHKCRYDGPEFGIRMMLEDEYLDDEPVRIVSGKR